MCKLHISPKNYVHLSNQSDLSIGSARTALHKCLKMHLHRIHIVHESLPACLLATVQCEPWPPVQYASKHLCLLPTPLAVLLLPVYTSTEHFSLSSTSLFKIMSAGLALFPNQLYMAPASFSF